MTQRHALYVGIDVGTSGVRAVAIDAAAEVHGRAAVAMPLPADVQTLQQGPVHRQPPQAWWQAVQAVLDDLFVQVPAPAMRGFAVDGTSGTVLVTDALGVPMSEGWMYDDASCIEEAARVAAAAPADSPARGSASPLARMLRLQRETPRATHLLHQADWVAGTLCGHQGWSDANNALKLGHDAVRGEWPGWMDAVGARRDWLPVVHLPGQCVRPVADAWCRRWALPPQAQVVAGSTDGVSAFLATGARAPGEAVTSLGSTLVLKLVTPGPVASAAHGVYSHRLGTKWLAGGASNSGGAALLRFFTLAQIEALAPALQPDTPTGLHYHPLAGRGERFPVADPLLTFDPAPRPASDAVFLQGLLEGIAEIERAGYQRLAAMGGVPLRNVRTAGGGARNAAWQRIRARVLGVPMLPPVSGEAAYGSALLARQGVTGLPPGA
jgi:sugar (pentulose or hexulose) kinase